MNPGSRLSLALLAGAAVAAVAIVLMREDADAVAAPGAGGSAVEDRGHVASATDSDDAGGDPTRAVVPAIPREREHDQGIHGRVVDELGRPVPGAAVHLVAGRWQQDPFTARLRSQQGVVVSPLATAETDPGGRFELGVPNVSPSGYGLRIVSDRHLVQTVPMLTLSAGRYIDVGDVTLQEGLTLSGRVTAQRGDGAPIPDARVTVRTASALPAGAVPGGDGALEARADGDGRYRIDGLPAGVVAVVATAPGFGTVEQQGVELRSGAENRVDFALPAGLSIVGVVVDEEGVAVAGARVDAAPAGAMPDAEEPVVVSAETDASGRFEVLGLADDAYQLAVVANGFGRHERKSVRAGARDERFVLRRQATIAVRAMGSAGPLSECEALLRAYDAARDTVGHAPTARVVRVQAGDLQDGWFRIPDVQPGTYVVQVDADGHARTFSAPFVVELDAAEPAVGVAMRVGGTLTGRVVGAAGEPVSGVRIGILPHLPRAGALAGAVGAMQPHRFTSAATETDANGAFALPHLLGGSYDVHLEHPEYAMVQKRGVVVADGETMSLGDVVLVRGTAVRGIVTLDGAPAGGVKVLIIALADPRDPTAPVLRTDAESTADGRFVLSRWLPPGRYEARAMRQSSNDPADRVTDLQNTRREFSIAPGQATHELRFTMTSD